MTTSSAATSAAQVAAPVAESTAGTKRFIWLAPSAHRSQGEDDADRARKRAYLIVICFVTLIGLGLRLVFMNGPVGSDDVLYFSFARQIVHGVRLTKLDHAASRLALLLIVGGPGVLAGSLYVCGVVNIFISTTAQIVATVFAYREVNARAGLITAIVLGLDGLPISYAGGLWPDDLLSLAMILCAVAVFYAVRSGAVRSVQLMALAGVAAAFAYSVKDTGILLLPPVVLFILLWGEFSIRRRIVLVATFFAVFAAFWAAEGAFYLARAGDFFYRTHAIARVHNADFVPASGLIEFLHHGYWNLATTANSIWMMALPLFVGSICWLALLRRRDETTLFALIGGFVAVYLFFGTSSFVRFINLPFQERYFVPVVPFVVLPLVLVIGRASWPARREAIGLAVLGAACLVGGVVEAGRRSGTLYFTEGLRNAAIAATAVPRDGRPIYASPQTQEGLEAYLPPDIFARLRTWTPAVTSPGYYLALLREGTRLWPDTALSQPPPLGPIYLSVGLSQRRASTWFAVPRRPARDSAVVYIIGNR